MRIIDFHAHCFPDELAAKARESISVGNRLQLSYDCTVNGLILQMDRVGIDTSVVVPVATKPSQVRTINDWVAGIASDRIVRFGAMHQDFDDPAGELDRIEALGIHGIKIQSNWQGCRPDDPRMFPIYEAAGTRFIFVFHVGREYKVFPHELATPDAIANLRRLFPDLPIVAAHFGGYRMWDEAEEYLIGKDVYLDISCCFPELMPDDRLIRMIRAHGVEKVLFATDTPSADPKPQVGRLMAMDLRDDEREMIAWKNAARILGI
jgi:hypothetical protein